MADDSQRETNGPSPLPPVATIQISRQTSYSSQPSNGDKRGVSRRRKSGGDSGYVPSILDEDQERGNKRVCLLRGAMIATLLTATVVVASLTYVFVREEENGSFVSQYQDSVAKLAQEFQSGLDAKHDVMETLAAMYTSYGNDWPNVTMANFEPIARGLLKRGNARSITFSPIITQGADRISWEAYAKENASTAKATQFFEAEPRRNMSTTAFGIYEHDMHTDEIVYNPGYAPSSMFPDILVPVWQVAPIESNEMMVMLNLHSEKRPHRMRALDDLLQHEMETLSAIVQLENDKELRPSSVMFYPVFDEFGHHHNFRSSLYGHVKGAIGLEFSWDDALSKILPEYIKGVFCVLHTSIGQTYSYSVSGDQVTFLGEGDHHDAKYNHLSHTAVAGMEQIEKEHAAVDNLITYTLTMYPSQELEDQYSTNRAVIYTVGVVMIFMFTAGLFLLYDYLVENRQQRTARLARRSSNIVEGMFPAAFHDRLYKRHDSTPAPVKRKSMSDSTDGASIANDAKSRRQSNKSMSIPGCSKPMMGNGAVKTLKQIDKFIKSVRGLDNDINKSISKHCYVDEPIADTFKDTSIMFADIVGFTKWSSERSPHQVFQLLERLFSEFDSTADKLNVFKLGTIGDCYIAVTGIPEPIENHATVLTKFAFECGDKVKEVFADLDEEGLDTAKLDMRFGIHSGAITAGILRGTKSRFELFGDTINTASRMESTGKAGKIQVSEDTAELLRADQRGKWLRKRAEKIKAKGKGELQTFWATKEEGYRVSFLDDGKNLMKDGEEKNVKSSDENEVYCNEMNEGHAVKGVLDEFTSLNGKNAEDEETFLNDLEIYLSNQNPQILTGLDEEKGLTSSEANEVALVYYKPKHNMKDPSDGNTLPCGEHLDRVHS